MGRGDVEAGLHHLLELLAVVGDAAARAAEGVARADDDGKIADQLVGGLKRVGKGLDGGGAGHVEADLEHGLLEDVAGLALFDRLRAGADHFDAVFFKDARLVQIHREVQAGLPAEGRQEGVGTLLRDDLFEGVHGERLDVGDVGELRVRHDGGRVAVDQDDAVAFLAQRLAGLGAGIVELAGLADDDGAGADDQDGL